MTSEVAAPADMTARNAEHRKSWYWYDWANSAYVTTTGTVLLGPYLTTVAKAAACPDLAEGAKCTNDLSVLGVPVDPGSLVPYTVTAATILSAIVLIFVGAIADRSPRPARGAGRGRPPRPPGAGVGGRLRRQASPPIPTRLTTTMFRGTRYIAPFR